MDGLKYKAADAIDPAPIRGFLARYPNDPNAGEAQDQLRKVEQGHIAKFRNDGRRASAIRYVELFPEGVDVAEAKGFIAGAGDDRTWINVLKIAPNWFVRSQQKAAVQSYLDDWPEGRHVAEAKALLEKLIADQIRADRIIAAVAVALVAGGLWFAYAAASYLVPQIRNALPIGLDDVREEIAKKIAPEPEAPPVSPEQIKRDLGKSSPPNRLGASTDDLPTFEERIKARSNLNDALKPFVATPQGATEPSPLPPSATGVPLDPSKSQLPPTGQTFSVNTLDAMRNIRSPNAPAEGETEDEFNRRMMRKNLPSAGAPGR